VRQAVPTGADLTATRRAVTLDAYRRSFGGNAPDGQRRFDALFGDPIVEAAFNQLKGERATSPTRDH